MVGGQHYIGSDMKGLQHFRRVEKHWSRVIPGAQRAEWMNR